MNATTESHKRKMEFIDKEQFDRVVRGLLEDVTVLQIKVGALESLTLKDEGTRAKYTEMVSEQAEAAIRQRKGGVR